MFRWGEYLIRYAATSSEIAQIHQLNYKTFVQEVAQHHDNGSGVLVDKFHDKNRYLICLKQDRVVGMLSSHDTPPFSIADRLPDASILTQPGIKPVEIRLLAVEPEDRYSIAPLGLFWVLYQNCKKDGYTHFVISAVVEQLEVYEHLGFEALGPAVGETAKFVPMWLSMEKVEERMGRTMDLFRKRDARKKVERSVQHQQNGSTATAVKTRPRKTVKRVLRDSPICLLPGPVALSESVQQAFREPLLYHRSEEFLPLFEDVRARLSEMVGGKPVGLFVGSGTLGNEAVAATIAADPAAQNGLLLVSGEFGGRLLKQAERWGLRPRKLEWDWGRAWNLGEVEETFKTMAPGGWVWGAHHETSTGVLNNLPGLVDLAKKYQQRLCVDIVSSLATVPLDLSDVWMATGASGKAIGSYAGIAFVFADPASLAHLDASKIPSYFDIAATITTEGPRFTMPSPLISALHAALEVFATPASRKARYAQIAELGEHVREKLDEAGFTVMAPAALANPSIVTFSPPPGLSAAEFVMKCRSWGYQIAGQSGYLAERNLVQVAVMGHVTAGDLDPLLEKLNQS